MLGVAVVFVVMSDALFLFPPCFMRPLPFLNESKNPSRGTGLDSPLSAGSSPVLHDIACDRNVISEQLNHFGTDLSLFATMKNLSPADGKEDGIKEPHFQQPTKLSLPLTSPLAHGKFRTVVASASRAIVVSVWVGEMEGGLSSRG